MKRHNIHIHTTYSDGSFSAEKLVNMAKNEKLEVIGITDHAFTTKIKSLNEVTLPGYINDLKLLKEKNSGSGIELKIGLEIDTCYNQGIDPCNVPFDLINKLDYVLFEYIRVDKGLKKVYRNIESVVNAKKDIKIPVGLAHTDISMALPDNKDYIKLLGDNDIFVEINLSENSNYHFLFNKDVIDLIKKYNIKMTIGTDFHSDIIPAYCLSKNISLAMNFIEDKGLKIHEIAS
ncbi:PHP domain protein [uncultured archaeon]|nr:PHP domain protein [uncultured archaeon]